MDVKVLRYAPESGKEACFVKYDVPALPDWTVMDVLDYISEHLDSTLAYYRHSACDHGICGRCAVKVNGKTVLACTTEVGEYAELVLEPRAGQIVRDIAVK